MSADDWSLMARTGEGDRVAFRLLLERHGPASLRLATRCLGTAGQAEDIVQEAFLRVWREAPRWRPQARLSTWLYRVVVNLCTDQLRKPRSESLDLVPEPPDEREDAETALHGRQVGALVERTLAGLPERQRQAVALCYYEGMTAAEAAEVLDLSPSAVEALLHRARRSLREELAPLLGRPGATGREVVSGERKDRGLRS